MVKLDKKAIWLFWLKDFFILGILVFFLFVPFVNFLTAIFGALGIMLRVSPTVLGIFLVVGNFVVCFSLVAILSWGLASLQYQAFSFTIEERRIVIKKGVLFKKIITIPFTRIQNVNITRNPLTQLLGLSEIVIQTAGISGVQRAEGKLPGVAAGEAEGLRDRIMAKVQGQQGL